MKQLVSTITFLLFFLPSLAQQYSGVVVDSLSSEPLIGATVQFFNKSNAFVSGMITDANGRFSFATQGEIYKVTVSYVGYSRFVMADSVSLTQNLGTIRMQSGQMLEDVVVKADLRRQTLDTDIYLITDSLRKGISSASQLLEKLPGVYRDWFTDEITINGESDIVLLVDGVEKPIEYFKRVNPKRITNVEVTYNPKGKYQNHAILVDLKLKQDYVGWELSPNTRDAYFINTDNSFFSINNVPFTYTHNNLSFYISTEYQLGNAKNANSQETNYQDKVIKKTGALDMEHPNDIEREYPFSATLGLDYAFNDNHKLSIQYTGDRQDYHSRTSYDFSLVQDGVQSSIEQLTKDNYTSDDYTFGLFYSGKFKSLKVNSDISYNKYLIDEQYLYREGSTYNNRTHGDKDYIRYYLNLEVPILKTLTASMDYALTWREYNNTMQETGTEIYHSINNRNRVSFTLSYNPVKNFGIRAGIGWNNVKDKSSEGNTDHTTWEPGGWLYWKPFKKATFRSYYTCVTSYPNLSNLTTNSYLIDTWITHIGNPRLKPTVSHSVNNTFTIDKWFTLLYKFEHRSNMINTCYEMQDDMTYMQSFFNADKTRHTLSANGQYTLAKNLRWNIDLSYTFEKLKNAAYNCNEDGHVVVVHTNLDYHIAPLGLNARATYTYDKSNYATYQGKYVFGANSLFFTLVKPFLKGRLPVVLNILIPVDKMNDERVKEVSLKGYNSRKHYSFINNSSYAIQIAVQYYLKKGKSTRKSNHYWVTDSEKKTN